MSRSPETATPEAAEEARYRLGWKALSELIGQGRSFSGHEKNCAFLNTGNGRFADISAATGLDFADDGRAVAVADWNFDGRPDIWTTNRNAPRARLLLNRGSGGHWLAVRLRGASCNRDAIGARVVVALPDGSQRTKSLHAGDGFLAQSSKWLHFGLGDAREVRRILVHWPGGKAEEIEGTAADQSLTITQGTGVAHPWKSTVSTEMESGSLSPVAPENATRTWLVGRLPLPSSRSIPSESGSPLLVNLWSRICAPCVAELSEWTENEEKIRASGLGILALEVDTLAAREADRPPDGFPFRTGSATADLVEAMELLHRTFVELQQPLPVPASFLLDGKGRVAAIYKGRIPLFRLLDDVALLARPGDRNDAVSFRGRWASNTYPPQPIRYAESFATAGKPARRTAYLREYVSQFPDADVHARLGALILAEGKAEEAIRAYAGLFETAKDLPRLHREAGIHLLQKNLAQAARKHLRVALPAFENDPSFRFNLGLAEAGSRHAKGALENFRAVVALEPSDADAHFQIGNVLHATKRSREAVPHYREALRLRPGWAFPANNLAWLLATDKDSALRDGTEAVRLAGAVVRADGGANPSTLSTLAAAQAETGALDEAIATAKRAHALAKERGDQRLAAQVEAAIRSYAAKKPLRSP